MKLNIKVILLGGLAFYIAQWIPAMVTGPLIHEGVLTPIYMATASFWRPELNQQPPDMAALMPRWIATGLIATFVMTAIFDNIRSALTGHPIVKGLKYGLIAFLFAAANMAGWSGVFNLPETIWAWWAAEALIIYLLSGAVLGLVVGKLAPE
ncbi:MAG: hypothetical protein KJO33_14800 [Gammaproteobacteria bacterium]|nr:hypothetical protein [Gammaproteobacteria bacterium]